MNGCDHLMFSINIHLNYGSWFHLKRAAEKEDVNLNYKTFYYISPQNNKKNIYKANEERNRNIMKCLLEILKRKNCGFFYYFALPIDLDLQVTVIAYYYKKYAVTTLSSIDLCVAQEILVVLQVQELIGPDF